MEPQGTGVKTWQWVVTVLVIVVLIIVGIMVFGGKKTAETPVTPADNSTAATSSPTALNRIVMTDQYLGNVVYLSSVQLANPSWVVIQADNNGQPGAIIGSAHFDAGMTAGGKINLTKSMVEGGTYYAVIYTDDGSGTFSSATDQPLKDDNGNIILKVFHASASVSAGLKG